ncbi:hypothetical protein SAE01_42680 [Segetibacter aerophilus]|uniref:Polysaccharide pyruvyl transferase domain-containing protein n=2 Tax=Segetibacter aerophilus TaxID=670293 RepID=A0A512BIH0_9BACT|nr:hypothetical protein SAE01_42680 [Segetibacter aerophilus]
MKILSKATQHDLIVIGGGGLIMDYFVPFWKAFKSIADRVPFVIWGIGCCDLKREGTLPPVALIEEIVQKSKLCIVRDELSRSFLSNCNLPDPIPCPSINYIELLPQHGNGILHVANYTTAGEIAYNTMREISQNFAESTGGLYRETNNRIERDSEKEMEHVLLRYKKSELVVSSALHGCIIGVAMGLKVIAVSGDRKVDAFMEAVGLKDWVLDVGQIEKISEYLTRISFQISPKQRIVGIKEKNRGIAYNIRSLLLEAPIEKQFQ